MAHKIGEMKVAFSYRGASDRWSCNRKPGYNTPGYAEGIAARINARAGETVVRKYGCTNCGKWHVGRAPGAGSAAMTRVQQMAHDDAMAILAASPVVAQAHDMIREVTGATRRAFEAFNAAMDRLKEEMAKGRARERYQRRTGFLEHRAVRPTRRQHNGRLRRRANANTPRMVPTSAGGTTA